MEQKQEALLAGHIIDTCHVSRVSRLAPHQTVVRQDPPGAVAFAAMAVFLDTPIAHFSAVDNTIAANGAAWNGRTIHGSPSGFEHRVAMAVVDDTRGDDACESSHSFFFALVDRPAIEIR